MNNKQIDVRITDLLAMLLKRLKAILCFALILGLLGSIYGAVSFVKAQPQAKQVDAVDAEKKVKIAELRLARAENALSFRDRVEIPNAEQDIEHLEHTIQQLREYMKDSIYYGMNPYHRGAAHLRFSVEVDNTGDQAAANAVEDTRAGIIVAYTQMFPCDSTTLSQIQEIMGIEKQEYIKELITVSDDDDHHVVDICVRYDDLQIADQTLTYLYQTMTARAKESLPKHQVQVLSSFSGYEVDHFMIISHEANEKALQNAESALQNAEKKFKSLTSEANDEKAVILEASQALHSAQEELQDAQNDHVSHRISRRAMLKRAVKFSLFGGLVGLMLGCCIVLLKGLFSGVIQNQSDITNRYPFPLIGVMPFTKKRWFDKLIRRLEGESTVDNASIIQATVQSLISRVDDRSVCLISSSSRNSADLIASYTENRVQTIGSILDNAEAIRKLSEFTGVVLVEERGKSRIDSIDAEILRAKSLGKDIIGIVLI